MEKKLRNTIIFFLILAFIVAWSTLLHFITPQELVDMIGVRNGYVLSFLFGVFGEAATLTALSYYPAVITLAAGGLNPFLLGVIAGAGMTVGNSLYFYLGIEGRSVLSERMDRTAKKVLAWIDKKPGFVVQVLIFLYVGFTPLPNNLLTATSGVLDYKYKKLFAPLLLGNIVLTTSIAYLTSAGLHLV